MAAPAVAQKKYDTGASDKEIVFGHTNPYSGPASAYGTIGKSIAVEFIERLRDDHTFASAQELAAQIARDVDHARASLRRHVEGVGRS